MSCNCLVIEDDKPAVAAAEVDSVVPGEVDHAHHTADAGAVRLHMSDIVAGARVYLVEFDGQRGFQEFLHCHDLTYHKLYLDDFAVVEIVVVDDGDDDDMAAFALDVAVADAAEVGRHYL